MQNNRRHSIIVFIIGAVFVGIAVVQCFSLFFSDGGKKEENSTKEKESIEYYGVGDTVRLKQTGKEEIYPFEVTVLDAVYQDELADEDGYYQSRGNVGKALEAICQYGGKISFHSDVRYITVDLKVKRTKLTEAEKSLIKGSVVYEFQELRLYNKLEGENIESTVCNPTDYRVLEGDSEAYEITSSQNSAKCSVLVLEEGEEVTIRLVYMIPFIEDFLLYHPCLNLTGREPGSSVVGSGNYISLDVAFADLNIDRKESNYPLSVSKNIEKYKNAAISIQDRPAAKKKAAEGLLNYEIAEKEKTTGLTLTADRLTVAGESVFEGLRSGDGTLSKTDTYTAFENVTGVLHDTAEELPEYFSHSEALEQIIRRYTEEGGFREEELDFLTVQYTYNYYAKDYEELTIHNLQTIWLYDRKADGLFYPYGYADDYRILNAETAGNAADSPYLYLKNGETAVVELVYVIPKGSWQELYLAAGNRLLWQNSVDGLYMTFGCVLNKETE